MWRALDHLGAGMALCDLEGRVLAADRAFGRILRKTPDQTIGLSNRELTHPDDLVCNERLISLLHATHEPFRIAKRYVVGSTPIWVENHVSLLQGGKESKVVVVLSRRLDTIAVPRALTAAEASDAHQIGGYIGSMVGQLAEMARLGRLPVTATALSLAERLMREELEDLPDREPEEEAE